MTSLGPTRWLIALAVLAAAGCRDQSTPTHSEDDGLGQRVFPPPPRVGVRAVPPHRIQPDGLGPYELGGELKKILNTLPHGPRIELLRIEHVVGYRLVRAAQDTVLIGIDQNERVSFIAVLDPEIAKTEGGLGVGSEVDKLRDVLGPERRVLGARDPRLVELERLPNARVLVENDRAVAIVIGPDGPAPSPDIAPADALSGGGPAGSAGAGTRPAPPPPPDDGCTEASAREALAGEPLAAIAKLGGEDEAEPDGPGRKPPVVHYGCFTGTTPEAVVEGPEQLVLVLGEPGRLRRGSVLPAPGLLFANAVDTDGDGRHELVVVSEQRTADELAVRVEVLRGESSRLVGAGADEVYRVTSGAAAPVGAKLKDVDLLLEVSAGPEALEVTGFYVHEVGGDVQSVAPLLPKTVVLRPKRRETGGSGARGSRSPSSESQR